MGRKMTREQKIAEFKKKLERIWEIRQMKHPDDDKKPTPLRYDDIYYEGVRLGWIKMDNLTR